MRWRRLFNAPHGGVMGFSAVALYAMFELGRLHGIWWPLVFGGPLLAVLVAEMVTREARHRRRWRRDLVRWQKAQR